MNRFTILENFACRRIGCTWTCYSYNINFLIKEKGHIKFKRMSDYDIFNGKYKYY